MIEAFADLALLGTEDGGLRSSMDTPCRSLLLRVDGASIIHAQFDFWDDVTEVYLAPGQAFEICYPNHVVARGTITSVFPVTPA